MIQIAQGNLLKAPAEALVNAVNTMGLMGKGIALQFKQAFPAMFHDYTKACHAGQVRLGKMHVYDRGDLTGGPRWIINFPTKGHWRERSRLIDIETSGRFGHYRSLLGNSFNCDTTVGLRQRRDVRPRIEADFTSLPEVEVFLFEPQTETQRSAPRP
jgi:hypothetical protein